MLPLAGIFVLVQVAMNMQLADVARATVPQNGPLVALSTDGAADPATRCAVLAAWAAEPWPDYYRDSIVANLQADYQAEFGHPFCARFPGSGR